MRKVVSKLEFVHKSPHLVIMQYSCSILQNASKPILLHSKKCYDVAIVGAGISSAYTLIHYISQLEEQAVTSTAFDRQCEPVKILVTEKSGEFWTGIPYGSRSGRNSLLISSLKEFIPQQLERQYFIDWLTANRDWLFEPPTDGNGELASKWLQANEPAMSQGLWDEMFIPRHAFGLYLKQRMANLLETAISKGLIEIDLLAADVMDIQRSEHLYRIDVAVADRDLSAYTTKKVVLAIGSPPNVAFANDRAEDERNGICYIDNMYSPSLDFNIDRMCQALQKIEDRSQRQVLIVGSNAGTLDTLYSINNSQAATSAIEKFVILSPNGAFPHRISREIPQIDYAPKHLLALVATKSFTAKQILLAVQQDVADATAKNINISDIYADISKVVIQCLNRLNFGEQRQFVSKYAVEIGKLQRRAGGEYLDVVDNLIDRQKLEFLKGKFVRYFPLATGGCGCEYVNGNDRSQQIFDAPIGVIINCAGFQDVTKSSSVLIQNLLRREICVPNDSNRGFLIDRNFEASKNCYVMGPLVAGNIDGNLRVWHAESCQRIINLSQQLATVLLQTEQQSLPTVIVPNVESVEPIGVLVKAA
jgi:uncharacterized NAD(P)/FAD-binding protein YdhS